LLVRSESAAILALVRTLGDLTAVEWSVLAIISIALGAALTASGAAWGYPLGLVALAVGVRAYLRRSA
jgi:mannose/fructose/N-acetylgalactosamine-specific phosphotransferase system component IID